MTEYLSSKFRFLSFVSAVLVVLIHMPHPEFARLSFDWWCVEVVLDTFTRVAVPYFFFVSGLLLFRNYETGLTWYCNVLGKRIRTLLIPFLLANILALVISIAKTMASVVWHGYPASVLAHEVCRCAYLALGVDFTKFPLVGSLWFVRNLLVLITMSPLVYWFVVRNKKIGAVVIAATFVLWVSPLSNIQFFRIGFSFEGLFWFILGAYFSSSIVYWHPSRNSKRLCYVSFLLMLIFGVAARIWMPEDFAIVGRAMSITAGLVFIFKIYDIMADRLRSILRSPILSTSFFIYMFQFIPLIPVSFVVVKCKSIPMGCGTLVVLSTWVVTTITLVAVSLTSRKKWPKAYAFMLGGR